MPKIQRANAPRPPVYVMYVGLSPCIKGRLQISVMLILFSTATILPTSFEARMRVLVTLTSAVSSNAASKRARSPRLSETYARDGQP